MKMSNELTTQNQENEIVEAGEITIRENKNYVVVKNEEGKFKRKAKFEAFSTFVAETRKDKAWLFNLFEGTEDQGNGLKDHVGKQFTIVDVITRPYDRINEDTGKEEYGVLTYLITPDRVAYVTSSKNVFFTVKNLLENFGEPSKEEPYIIKVLKEKAQNGDMIKIKLIG
jgi:hypothetical protein